MTQKQPAKPSSDQSAKIVVFGVDSQCKPHAAWFSKAENEAARSAAKQLRFNAIEIANGTAADLTAKLPQGRIHASGPSMVPIVRDDLYEKLVGTINAKGEAGREPSEPTASDIPKTWDAIKPGHVVLAQDSLTEGWWAALVVERSGDKITFRWRDYPGHPKVSVRANEVALVSPASA